MTMTGQNLAFAVLQRKCYLQVQLDDPLGCSPGRTEESRAGQAGRAVLGGKWRQTVGWRHWRGAEGGSVVAEAGGSSAVSQMSFIMRRVC